MTAEVGSIDTTELAARLRTRGLVRTVSDGEWRRLDDNYAALIEALATIFNATDAPPIDLHIEAALSELTGPNFFLVQQILCDLIPLLNVDLDVLIPFVVRLHDAGGNDLAAGAPIAAIGEWTRKDSIRPPKVYEAARRGDRLALRLLFTVLRVNNGADEALMFARADEREAKLPAISALGAMELGDRYGEVLETLIHEASSDDEDIAILALDAGYRAAARQNTCAPSGLDEQLKRVLQTPSPKAIHFAANLLWLPRNCLTESNIDLCLDAVADVDPNNNGTINCIDHATYQLVVTGCAEKAVRLLGELFDRSKGKITLDAFKSTYHALQDAGSDVLGSAVVYWLLNGGVYTRRCIANEVCSVGNDAPTFSIPSSVLPLAPSDQMFLCRKAIGWLFIDPLAAVAIPLAVLRDGSPNIANDVLDLIYNPLLLSYGGKLKEYLEKYNSESEGCGSGLAELLTRKTALQDAMEGIERLVELHPSEAQREAERVQWNEQVERSMEQGRRKSIISELFTRQYILYGSSSLTEVHTGEGTTHLAGVEMKSFSISSEIPLLNIVDPVGLDRMLAHFKLESRGQ